MRHARALFIFHGLTKSWDKKLITMRSFGKLLTRIKSYDFPKSSQSLIYSSDFAKSSHLPYVQVILPGHLTYTSFFKRFCRVISLIQFLQVILSGRLTHLFKEWMSRSGGSNPFARITYQSGGRQAEDPPFIVFHFVQTCLEEMHPAAAKNLKLSLRQKMKLSVPAVINKWIYFPATTDVRCCFKA